MSVDSIGDFLTIIRNGVLVAKREVVAPYSRMADNIAALLREEGFIKEVITFEEDGIKKLKLSLHYVDGESVIHEITRMSTPGRRMYESIAQSKPVVGGLGVTILTTNRGVITNKTAKRLGVGGEVICTVW